MITYPLLHGLLVVLGAKSCVGTAMVDLHLRARALVARVHVEYNISPRLRSSNRVSLGAGAVPGVDTS